MSGSIEKVGRFANRRRALAAKSLQDSGLAFVLGRAIDFADKSRKESFRADKSVDTARTFERSHAIEN
jgi:hypothetical protein